MKNKTILFHILLISLGVAFYFIANFERMVLPGSVFDVLANELNVSATYITAFGAIFMYVYALGQLIMGILVDKYGGHRVLLAGASVLAVGCMLFPVTNSLTVMYLSRALIGLGCSSFYLSLVNVLKNSVSDKNFGVILSIVLFIGYMGGFIANAPFIKILQYVSFKDAMSIISIVVVIVLSIYALCLKTIDIPKIKNNVKIRLLPFRLVLHKKHNRNLFEFACCNYAISYVIQIIVGKKFLEDFCGYSSSKAAIFISVIVFIAAIFNVVNAFACKVCHNKRVLFLKSASVVTFVSLLIITTFIMFNIKTIMFVVIFGILAANASLTSILVPVLHMTNKKMVSGTAVSIMNFSFFMMLGFLGTLTGFLLDVFKPEIVGTTTVYARQSYILVFGLFFLLSAFEMYKAAKLSNKY